VTVLPPEPGLPSDKLIPPLNAPRAGQVSPGVQPGVSGNIILAQYVIIFGTSGGMFVYAGSPGLGNPPVYSFGNVVTDPYGNTVEQGIWAGQPGANQIGIQANPAANFAAMFFVIPGTFLGDALVLAVGANGQSTLELSSAVNPAPDNDRVVLLLFDNKSAGGSALWELGYYDTSGNFHLHGQGSYSGSSWPVVAVNAADPAHGTSLTDPAIPETWHAITPDAGWTSVQTPQYRLLPDGNVQVAGLLDHAGTTARIAINSAHPIPSAYQPSVTRYYRTPMPSPDFAGSVEIDPGGIFYMRASGFTAVQAILDGIYAR